MRHGKKVNHLGRQKGHRDAMLSNMAASLILNKRINTTVAKAKALRGYVEPLITRSKEDTTHSRRMVFRYLQNKSAVAELFRDVAPKVAERPGGYTRIIRLENRLGDNAEMCMMELVDFNELLLGTKETKKGAKTTRRGRKKATTATAEAATEASSASASETSAEAKPKKAAAKKKKSDEKKDEE
jgi:large subunit ribosomal protein L17